MMVWFVSNGVLDLREKKDGFWTNGGLEFDKKNGFESNGVLDLIGEWKKKDGV